MKKLKYVLLMLLCVCIWNCSDKKEKKSVLNTDFLQQTSWEGLYSVPKSNVSESRSYPVAILFVNDERGKVKITQSDRQNYEFTYSIENNKLLRIDIVDTILLHGDWILFEIGKDYMLFKQNYYGDNEGSTLELQRQYG